MDFHLLWSYLCEKRKTFLVIAGSAFIFALLFALYQIPMRYIGYPMLLCSVFLMVAWGISYMKYCRKHHMRQRALQHADLTLEELPKPENLSEQDYHELLRVILERKNNEIAEYERNMRELTEYVTLWTHQMKTPITAMQLVLQELEDEKKSILETQLFEEERYVDTLLQYLRLDTMNADLVLQHYLLEDIVKQSVRYFSKTFIMKKIGVELQALDCSVVTDEKWLVFCVKQILSNALKYTATGGMVKIYTTPGSFLVIEDNGIGIAAEDLPRIFEKGFTGYNGRMDKKATGIGLFLTKGILDKLGHTISITSEPDIGTKVTIDFQNLTKL